MSLFYILNSFACSTFCQGYITPAELYTFFQTIHEMWVAIGEYADLSVYDVVDEILDMINPKVSMLRNAVAGCFCDVGVGALQVM